MDRRERLAEGASLKLERGTVVLVELDPTIGHEQRGVRPCIVVGDPDIIAHQRFPLIAVLPVTGTLGEGAIYPRLEPGSSGLTKTSCALVDHVRSIDKRRVRRIYGNVGSEALEQIDDALGLFLGLDAD
jgi:mRNA interferase MazF